MSPISTVATSKTPGMEIRKARPSADSHGLADFHLRHLIPSRRKQMTGYYEYTIFRDCAGLLRDFEDAVEFLAQCCHILSDLVIGDLGRGDPFMSQHLAEGFQRYALRKRNRRGEGVPHVWQHAVSHRKGL